MQNKRLILQWHITEKCNLRCVHCYQTSYCNPDPSLSELGKILDQYIDFLIDWNKKTNNRFVRSHINITGGEPFLRSDLVDFLEIIDKKRDYISFALLSNGSLLTPEIAKKLKSLNTSFVQLSVEGDALIHNAIRGENNLKTVEKAIKILKQEKIRVYLSFTANSLNYLSFRKVASFGRKLGVSKVWADRMVPTSNSYETNCHTLDTQQSLDFFKLMNQEKKRFSPFRDTKIEMNRALMFLETKQIPYHCSAGDTLLTLLPNGDLLPCRRLPIKLGNILETSFNEIYSNNPVLQQLRAKNVLIGCEKCSHFVFCKGGAKCISFAKTGSFLNSDPACPFSNSKSTPNASI